MRHPESGKTRTNNLATIESLGEIKVRHPESGKTKTNNLATIESL